jgi:TfoX/Sxy family transcriptional regulator of competence genes
VIFDQLVGYLFTEFEMAADETLSNRVRALLSDAGDVVEKKMFGGLAFLVQGNMSVGVHGSELIVRIDPAETDDALAEPGVRIFDITGRPMRGWLLVSTEALSDETSLVTWVERGVSYARSLPAK